MVIIIFHGAEGGILHNSIISFYYFQLTVQEKTTTYMCIHAYIVQYCFFNTVKYNDHH